MKDAPIKAQTPDIKKIRCRDCLFRDTAQVKLASGKVLSVGVTRYRCDKYQPPMYHGKPMEILFQNADCEYYIKDGSV